MLPFFTRLPQKQLLPRKNFQLGTVFSNLLGHFKFPRLNKQTLFY